MKSIIQIFVLFGLMLAFAVSNASENNSKTSIDLPKVMLEEIKTQKDHKRILLPLKVEPKILSIVSADLEGSITRILKPLGSEVKSGEIVMYLENRDPGFTYAPVPVRSPISGILSQVSATQMSKVSRGDKLFTVTNPKVIKLTGELPSADLSHIKLNMMGTFSINTDKDKIYSVKVTGVSPLVDPRTGTANLEFEFQNKGKNVELPAIGSIGQALIEIDRGEIIMIPETALIYRDGKPMVRVLQGENKFAKKSIELGEQRDSQYVIKSGITSGEKLIVRSSRPLKEGESIEVEKPSTQVQ